MRQAEEFGRAQVHPYNASAKDAEARSRRKNPTGGEAAVARYLARTKVPFRREHNIDGFVTDFYIPSTRTVIEVDGGVHQHQQERDIRRDDWLRANHYNVVRISNADACATPQKLEDTADLELARRKAKSRRAAKSPGLTREQRKVIRRDGLDAFIDDLEARKRSKQAKKPGKTGAKPAHASPPQRNSPPGPKPSPPPGPPPKRRHACRSCGKRFVAPTAPVPTCRECGGQAGVVCRDKRCNELLPPSRNSGLCDSCLRRDLDIRQSRKGGLQSYWDNGQVKRHG